MTFRWQSPDAQAHRAKNCHIVTLSDTSSVFGPRRKMVRLNGNFVCVQFVKLSASPECRISDLSCGGSIAAISSR